MFLAAAAIPAAACPTRRSADPVYDGAIHTARVVDSRPLSGDNAAAPRTVAALPFQDQGDTSKFADDYSCQAQVQRSAGAAARGSKGLGE